MRVLVTGVNGQLGHDVVNWLKKRGYFPVGTDIGEALDNTIEYYRVDITDKEKIIELINRVLPDGVIHCAAWTAVDAAEDEQNKEKVYANAYCY